MRSGQRFPEWTCFVAIVVGACLAPCPTWGHCDTEDGPVVVDARAALTAGDATAVLKWVQPADEPEVRAAFASALAVRGDGGPARELADRWFIETLVRLHRAGEGAPYTGLKPVGTPVDPAVRLADRALATGSPAALVDALTAHLTEGIRERFRVVSEAREHAGDSVAAGRAYVASYVEFTHYAERLHLALVTPAHGEASAEHAH